MINVFFFKLLKGFANQNFNNLVYQFFNFLLRKVFFFYDQIISIFFSTYSSEIKTTLINRINEKALVFIRPKIDYLFINNALEGKFRVFSLNFIDFNEKTKKTINFSNQNYSRNIYSLFLKKKKYNFIKWNFDYKKNFFFPNVKYFTKIKLQSSEGDPKIPWEIGRLQHLTQLSAFYLIEPKKKIKEIIKNHLFDFISSNPPKFGINWKSPMEVAIRGSNIVFSLDLLISRNFFTQKELLIILNYLNDHLKFILQNLEWSKLSTSNHYLSNIVGMMVISFFLPKSLTREATLNFAVSQLFNEIDKQFYDDGGNKEGSTGYHLLSNEMILIGMKIFEKLKSKNKKSGYFKKINSIFNKVSLIERNTKKMTKNKEKDIKAKILKINYFSSVLLRKDNTLLQIGDNDSGCFVPINLFSTNLEKKNLHFILNKRKTNSILSKELLKRKKPNNKYLLGQKNNDSKVLLSLKPEQKRVFFFKFPFKIDKRKIQNNFFHDFGLYHFYNKLFSLFIVCRNEYNYFNSGHIHDDNLSIDLVINKKPVITDPGSFSYASDITKRNFYRSNLAHFVPQCYGIKTIKFSNKNLFYIDQMLKAKCLLLTKNSFLGNINYENKNLFRKVIIEDNGIRVLDYSTSSEIKKKDYKKKGIKVCSSFGVISDTKAFDF